MAFILEINENGDVRRHQLESESLIAGRSSNCDLRLFSDSVSGRHAQFTVSNNGLIVEDLNSANGLFIDGKPVIPGQPNAIYQGSRIQLGKDGPIIAVLEGPEKNKIPSTVPSAHLLGTKALVGILFCLLLFVCVCGVGIIITGSMFLFGDSNIVRQIKNNDHQLASAVGLVVVGFEWVDSDGKKRVVPLGMGTCFAVSSDGYLFTNRHVVEDAVSFQKLGYIKLEGDDQIFKLRESHLSKLLGGKLERVRVWVILDQKEYSAQVVHMSEKFDFSILKIENTNMPYFRLSKTDQVPKTLQVFALGYPAAASMPFSKEEIQKKEDRDQSSHQNIKDAFSRDELNHSVSLGIVERVRVDENPKLYWIQHGANINPGNSGGPLCDASGVVVGLNTMGSRQHGLFLATSVNQLEPEISQHVKHIRWTLPK